MKIFLRLFLVFVYAALIALLLLQGCRRQYTNAQDVGGTGDLKITLLWNFHGDIDVRVMQPGGREISWEYKHDSSTGGKLDIDNQEGGQGSAENVFWPNPPKGTYTVQLHYFQEPQAHPAESGNCRVVVYQRGHGASTFNIPMNQVSDRKLVTKITVD